MTNQVHAVSLARQLMIAVVCLFLLVFAGNLAVSLLNNRTLVQEQMAVHAQDAATSLAMSISQVGAPVDRATAETLLNAVSDGGFYQTVSFHSVDDNLNVERHFRVRAEGVPDWFIRLVPLGATQGRAEVMDGWVRLGEVRIISHPGRAYMELWLVMVQQLLWFAGVTVAACALAWLALGWLTRPLARVEEQADAICNRHFIEQKTLPRTRELRRVVEAMNRLSRRMKSLFANQLDLINRLQLLAYRDQVTGLSNRRDFDVRVASLVEDPSLCRTCCIYLVALSDLEPVNQRDGRQQGNRILRDLGQLLTSAVADIQQGLVARRQGLEFAVLAPDLPQEEGEALCAELFDAAQAFLIARQLDELLTIHVGAVWSEEVSSVGILLQQVDEALKIASLASGSNWYFHRGDRAGSHRPASLQDWQSFIAEALDHRALRLLAQPIVSPASGETVGVEIFSRLLDDGAEVATADVIFATNRLGLSEHYDKTILQVVATAYSSTDDDGFVAVNLCHGSLLSETFCPWLVDWLSRHPALARRLVLEIPEASLQRAQSTVRALQDSLAPLGTSLAVDGFGHHSSSFSYLGSLRLRYVKVHRSFSRQVQHDSDSQFYIKSLLQLVHSRDIPLVVEAVESEESSACLRDLGADYLQGYFIGAPEYVY